MRSTNFRHEGTSIRRGRPQLVAGLGLLAAAALAITGASAALAAGAPGSAGYLDAAAPFAVLGGSSVTNTGAGTHLWGDVGVSPGTAIIGLQTNQVGGSQHAADTQATNAQIALTDSYNAAAGATRSDTVDHATIGGQTFVPGVYNAAAAMGLTGTVTLDGGGDANAVWVFQAGSTLTTATSSRVVVVNGNPCNVYWQVGSSATLGGGTNFIGTVLANTAITAVTGTTVQGRLLARNAAVTLDTTTLTQPVCSLTDSAGVTIPPSTPSPSPSATPTATPTPSASATPTATPTPSASTTAAPTATPTPSASAPTAPTPTGTPTSTPTASATPAPSSGTGTTPAPGGSGSAAGSGSPITPRTPGATGSPSASPTKAPTGTGAAPAPSSSGTPTTAPTPAVTRSPRAVASPTPTPTPSAGGTGSSSGTPSTLATTGSEVTPPLTLAGGLLALGALLLVGPRLLRLARRP